MCSHACTHVHTQQIDVNRTFFFNVTKERHNHDVFSKPGTVYIGPCDKQELHLCLHLSSSLISSLSMSLLLSVSVSDASVSLALLFLHMKYWTETA